MSEDRKPKLRFGQDNEVTFTFVGDSFSEIHNKDYNNTSYPHDVIDENGEEHTAWLSATLLGLLSRRGGNGPGNKYTCTLKKDGSKFAWDIKVLETSGKMAFCSYTNVEENTKQSVNESFNLEGAPAASSGSEEGESSGRGKRPYDGPRTGLPGTFEGDIGMAVECLAMAANVLQHPVTKSKLDDLDIGEPMIEQLMAITNMFYIAKNQRGQREPIEEAFVFPTDQDIAFDEAA